MVTQTNLTSQYFLGLSETEKLSAYQNLLSKIDDKDREIAYLRQINDTCKTIINNNRDHIEEIAEWMQWHIKMMSNSLVTSSEKERMIAYHDYMESQPIREDGSRYYSAHDISARLGYVKVQQVYKIHSLMQEAGLITCIEEQQKGDRTKKNTYDIISMGFWLDPDKICLKDHSQWGGMHAIHKDCGGECKGRFVYLCKKCGEDCISAKNVNLMSDQEYEDYLSLMAQAENMPVETLDKLAEEYEVTTHASELEREADKNEIESFQRSMHLAKERPRKQGYWSLEKDVPLYKKELSPHEYRSPP